MQQENKKTWNIKNLNKKGDPLKSQGSSFLILVRLSSFQA